MDDNFVLPFSFSRRVIRTTAESRAVVSILVVLFPSSQDAAYSCSKCSSLRPATVGERGIVGGRRSKMPLFVCLVESRTVPDHVSRG